MTNYNSDKLNISVRFALHLTIVLALGILFAFSMPHNLQRAYAGSKPSATALVDSKEGAILRKAASTSSKSLAVIKNNAKVTVTKEIFTSKTSNAKNKRWYYVSVSGKKGYIRADLLDNWKYSTVKGKTSDYVNYRTGAGTSFNKKGTMNKGTSIDVFMTVKPSGSSTIWYKIKKDSTFYYLSGDYIKLGTSSSSSSDSKTPSNNSERSEVATALLKKATDGGNARNVYTFNTSNCTKMFGVTGYSSINTPQGMTYTGDKYYILYGTDSGQRICTYSANGTRLTATKFSSNIGHPNGITWDPKTGLCYIFKGNQYKIYTWNPATNKFGTATTPYSSSGVAYDKKTGVIYCSSQTGIRVYSADGKFSHQKLFSRCTHSPKPYIQDCGAYGGIVFHGVSGPNKAKTNYIDVYRASNGTYMGSIIVDIGEIESCIVDNDGYLRMLVNTSGTTDYIWKTPLNVNELL